MQTHIIICLLLVVLLVSVNAGRVARRRRRMRENAAIAQKIRKSCEMIDWLIFPRPPNTCPNDLSASCVEQYNKNAELIEFWKKHCDTQNIYPPSFSTIFMGMFVLALIALAFVSICM